MSRTTPTVIKFVIVLVIAFLALIPIAAIIAFLLGFGFMGGMFD